MTRKVCAHCGGLLLEDDLLSYARSREWRADLREVMMGRNGRYGRGRIVSLCGRCKRALERTIYNWMNGLPQTHNPF
jgi:hypothetical protein